MAVVKQSHALIHSCVDTCVMCVKVYYSCMEKVSCDLLQQEYGTLKTLAEEYKGVLFQYELGADIVQQKKGQFDKKQKEVKHLIQERKEYFSYLRDLYFKDRDNQVIQEISEKYESKKEALAYIFTCRKDQISTTKEEALSGGIALHDGYLDLFGSKELSVEVQLPKYVKGGLNLSSLTELPKEAQLPECVGRNLYLHSLTKLPDDFTFPEHIGGTLHLNKKLKGHSALSTVPEGVPIEWD